MLSKFGFAEAAFAIKNIVGKDGVHLHVSCDWLMILIMMIVNFVMMNVLMMKKMMMMMMTVMTLIVIEILCMVKTTSCLMIAIMIPCIYRKIHWGSRPVVV